MPWSLQAAKRLSRSKNVFCTVEFCTAECNQSNPLSDEIHSTKLALSKELQKSPQTRHIERHTPHVSSHSMSKLLETHPPPKRTLFNGVCPFVFTAHTLHLKTSVSACRSKPFRIHPPACQNPWSHTQPQKHPFQWVYLLRIKRSIEHRHMGPLRSERFKCFGNKPRISARRFMHAPTQLPQTHSHLNRALQKRTPAINPCKPYAALTLPIML